MKDTIFRFARRVPILGSNRYFIALAVYMTPRKLINCIRAETARILGVVNPKARPYLLTLDTTNICNLKCRYCPTGVRQISGRDKTFMSKELVANSVLPALGEYVLIAYLFSWGEPLLNREIVDIVRLLHDRGIFTCISTNLSFDRIEGTLEQLCDAGLDLLLVSVDGVNQETYSTYRVSGHIEDVLRNIEHLIRYRRSKRRLNPKVDWRYLRFKFNLQEQSLARATATRLGVDSFVASDGAAPPADSVDSAGTDASMDASCSLSAPLRLLRWINRRMFAGMILSRGASFFDREDMCGLLWRSITINADGGVTPCCYLYTKRYDFGDLGSQGIVEVWNNESYRTARSMFGSLRAPSPTKGRDVGCLRCPMATKNKRMKKLVDEAFARDNLDASLQEERNRVRAKTSHGFFYPL